MADFTENVTIGQRLRQIRYARGKSLRVIAGLAGISKSKLSCQVLAVEALRAKMTATVAAHCHCDRDDEVGAALPGLVRDLHSSIGAGRDVAERSLREYSISRWPN